MSKKPKSNLSSLPPKFENKQSPIRSKLFLTSVFVLFLVIAFVVLILPNIITLKNSTPRNGEEKKLVAKEAMSGVESHDGAREVEELLQRILKLQARLENEGVKAWGTEMLGTNYEEILSLLDKANSFKDKLMFGRALIKYQTAFEKLQQIEKSRPERIKTAMEKGDKAIEDKDSSLAVEQFKIVIAADPGNSEARLKLKRAENLPQVLEYMLKGNDHENTLDWDLAIDMYSKAVSIDNNYEEAAESLKRVEALAKEKRFQDHITETITYLSQDKIEDAAQALNNAKRIDPDSEEIPDLELQLKSAELRIKLKRFNEQAQWFERSEEWEKALAAYDNALELDPNVGFALQGKQRSEKFLEFIREIDGYIADPKQLESPEHVKYAREIYEMSIANTDIGPKFRDNVEKLKNLLKLYEVKTPVLIKSDNKTNVRIYRVGKFGKFNEHRLKLRPGNYKALGVRSGYRDKSVVFDVPVSSGEITVEVFCEEKI